MKNNIYKGYIASRNIHELFIPQRIQNMVIRTYAEKKGKIFSLSATEYIMDDCFMMLKALADEAQNFESIVFYSIFMLPNDNVERKNIYHKILSQNCEIHFAFEELVIKNQKDIDVIEDIILAKHLTMTNKDPICHLKNL